MSKVQLRSLKTELMALKSQSYNSPRHPMHSVTSGNHIHQHIPNCLSLCVVVQNMLGRHLVSALCQDSIRKSCKSILQRFNPPIVPFLKNLNKVWAYHLSNDDTAPASRICDHQWLSISRRVQHVVTAQRFYGRPGLEISACKFVKQHVNLFYPENVTPCVMPRSFPRLPKRLSYNVQPQ